MNTLLYSFYLKIQLYRLNFIYNCINIFQIPKIKKITISIFFTKNQNNFSYETLYNYLLLQIISEQKGIINNYKKEYKSINFHLTTTLRKHKKNIYLLNFFILYNHFYNSGYSKNNKYLYKLFELTFMPFLPNIFSNWKDKIIVTFYFNSKNFNKELVELYIKQFTLLKSN